MRKDDLGCEIEKEEEEEPALCKSDGYMAFTAICTLMQSPFKEGDDNGLENILDFLRCYSLLL